MRISMNNIRKKLQSTKKFKIDVRLSDSSDETDEGEDPRFDDKKAELTYYRSAGVYRTVNLRT